MFSDQVQNDEVSPEENHQFCATTRKKIEISTRRRQRRKLTNQLSPNLSPNFATNLPIGLWFIIAILFVQFNLYVVPVQGRQPPLPMMEAKETYLDDQGRIQDDQLLFRILSGTSRIQWEMGVSRYTPERTREPYDVNK